MDKIITSAHTGTDTTKNIKLVRDLSDTMLNGSLCALGGMTPYPVLSAMNHFPEDFGIQA
jgi:formate dehydrogenase iron-sulfur subunit